MSESKVVKYSEIRKFFYRTQIRLIARTIYNYTLQKPLLSICLVLILDGSSKYTLRCSDLFKAFVCDVAFFFSRNYTCLCAQSVLSYHQI